MTKLTDDLEARSEFIHLIEMAIEECHQNAIDKGFHDHAVDDGTRIALMHAELSECLEALRHGNKPDDHITGFSGAEAELADVLIRIFDFCGLHDYRLGEAVLTKMAYNAKRQHMHGNKLF